MTTKHPIQVAFEKHIPVHTFTLGDGVADQSRKGKRQGYYWGDGSRIGDGDGDGDGEGDGSGKGASFNIGSWTDAGFEVEKQRRGRYR